MGLRVNLYDGTELSGYQMVKNYGYCNKFKIPPSTLETLLGHLEIGYARYTGKYFKH